MDVPLLLVMCPYAWQSCIFIVFMPLFYFKKHDGHFPQVPWKNIRQMLLE